MGKKEENNNKVNKVEIEVKETTIRIMIEKEIKNKTKETEEASAVIETEGGAPALTGAMKPLCIPLEQPDMPEGTKCFFTGKPAKRYCLWGRSY